MHATLLRMIAGAMISGLFLSGCIGDRGSADWQQITDERLTVQYPTGWDTTEPKGTKWTHAVTGDGMFVQISGAFSEDPTASAARAQLALPARLGLEGYKPSGVENLDIKDADSALRQDFTFTEDGKAMQGVWIIAGQWPYPRTGAISITGEVVDQAIVTQIIEKLTFNRYKE